MALIHDRLEKLEAAIAAHAPTTLQVDDVSKVREAIADHVVKHGRPPSVVIYPPGMPADSVPQDDDSRAVVVMIPNNRRGERRE